MNNMIMYREGEDPIITWIKKRVVFNLNFLSITTGPTGNGKSWLDLSIAEAIDPEFNTEKQVAFTFTEFMKALNGFNGDDEELAKKKYKVIIFDEIQVSISKREWQSKINKLFNYITSTFRHQNIIVFLNSPFSDFVDSNTMKLLHSRIETKGWNKKDGKSAARFKLLDYNERIPKMYEGSVYMIRGKEVIKLDGMWTMNKPSDKVIEVYERRKKEFTQRLNRQITEEIAKMEGNLNETEPKIFMKDLHQDIYVLYHTYSKKHKDIAEKLGKARATITSDMQTMSKMYPGWKKDANLLGKVGNADLVDKKEAKTT